MPTEYYTEVNIGKARRPLYAIIEHIGEESVSASKYPELTMKLAVNYDTQELKLYVCVNARLATGKYEHQWVEISGGGGSPSPYGDLDKEIRERMAADDLLRRLIDDETRKIEAIRAKLDTIEEGANKNVQADWEEEDTTSDAYIRNKLSAMTTKEIKTIIES